MVKLCGNGVLVSLALNVGGQLHDPADLPSVKYFAARNK